MNKIVKARNLWIESLHTGNLYGIMNCYHNQHTFKGTLNTKVTERKEDTEMYFQQLFNLNPKVVFVKSDIMKMGGTYMDYGTYMFDLNSNYVYATYQFTYKMVGDEPKIISHFSCKI